MKIYIAHAVGFDYQKELYEPFNQSSLAKEHTLIFPHDGDNELFDSKKLFTNGCDLVIAEVSLPATGLGIELGWANMMDIPIVCLSKKGVDVAKSLQAVCQQFAVYGNADELVSVLQDIISE